MAYVVKRIDPFWHRHPMVPTGIAIGLICLAVGFRTQKMPFIYFGVIVSGISTFFAARPALSALFAVLCVIQGFLQIFFAPSVNIVGATLKEKAVYLAVFTFVGAAALSAITMLVAGLYNLFSRAIGFNGIRVELETTGDD